MAKPKARKPAKRSPKPTKHTKAKHRTSKPKVQKQAREQIDLKQFEDKWQSQWQKAKLFEANVDKKRPSFMVTVPYPYVNGAPHIGAGFTFIRGDVYARYKRMRGFNVLYAQGFHATGEPIVGAVKRLQSGDQSQVAAFKMYGISDADIRAFAEKGPEYVAKFWKKRWMEDLAGAGFSIDWRRTFITTPMTPTYSRFVEWQYNTLRKRGYVTQGTHPVIWCPSCLSPTGDHDRLDGVGESTMEYTVVKFKLADGEVLPCATLRPETVYGVTNIWVNPDAEYVRAEIDGEHWIIGPAAAKKLADQLKTVKVLEKIMGSELVGKSCDNPVTKAKLPVLPASLCDVNVATGVVMSVPSHAPYDWIGLQDLKKDKQTMHRYNIESVVADVEPISIIKTEGFGEHPAKDACERLGVQSQRDTEKLEKATELLYKKEFHTGVCNDKCGPYADLKVAEAKQKITKHLVEEGLASSMWETTAPVVCRCKTRCHVKILENQWFLKFSDPAWKARAKECIKRMTFYPEDARQQFENTVDWLEDKACTRHSGMGTPLPWDKSWIVETLSDSTIYMAYYTLARIINERKLQPEQLTDEVFDYIFFGVGEPAKLSKASGLDKASLEGLHEEFDYFYPVGFRNSGKDLVQNHLTFFIFHHVAIWDKPELKKFWPRSIGVNGYVNVAGEKMSKSKGNFIPLRDLLAKFGADLVRINIVASNENMDDADWREDSIPTYESRLRYLFALAAKLKKAKRTSMKPVDRYLESRVHDLIKTATEHYEHTRFRSATQYGLFAMTNELKWYADRTGDLKDANKKVLMEAFETIVKLIAPLTPHAAEELWHMIGNKTFVSTESWPQADEKKIDRNALQLEDIYRKTMEDVKQVAKLAGKDVASSKLYLYFATDKEADYFRESAEDLKTLGFKKVEMFKVADTKKHDPQDKAKRAKFGRPAIYLE
ncbi:MAG: leucine--tRNA ligase [Candidatus Aenigmarchaeota archaeon]|nr:leucine--tRNA ligase [Candidatus Aenigmarchaeota archaeon]